MSWASLQLFLLWRGWPRALLAMIAVALEARRLGPAARSWLLGFVAAVAGARVGNGLFSPGRDAGYHPWTITRLHQGQPAPSGRIGGCFGLAAQPGIPVAHAELGQLCGRRVARGTLALLLHGGVAPPLAQILWVT